MLNKVLYHQLEVYLLHKQKIDVEHRRDQIKHINR